MMAKDKPYGKYILLSSPRSGTHMLRTVLRNHPNLVAHSELFNPDFLKDKPFGPETPAAEILEQHIYREYLPEIQKVGFIIHRSGTPFGDWPDLWEMLATDESVAVISLRRRNLLRRYLSYQVMRTFRGKPPQPLTFDPEILQKDFEYQEQEIKTFDQRFSQHPLKKVYYEDLCNNYHSTVQSVLDFLEVTPQKLWPSVEGKPKRKLHDAIANYAELKTYFSDTQWASFFNEEEEVIHITKPKPKSKPKVQKKSLVNRLKLALQSMLSKPQR